MASNALISYIGADKPGLISTLSNFLTEKGGSVGDTTFALLGAGAELNMIYELPKGLDYKDLGKEIKKMPEVSDGEVKVTDFQHKVDRGPSSRITHRIILSGKDQPGLLARVTRSLDDHGANIVRLNTEKLKGSGGDQYIARFAISLREERAPTCLAAIANIAVENKLTIRYETA
ncbi:MAG: ACT domain-containing protein [Rhodospirillaceae bacterium]|jgi:glycine cleavage system transcriptional repressor|nr:ACT domain-containing protein [Rhodospirillaceae bacterium]MBT5374771.1 ACT domain-containing protein [Rhodospirillaceae bacterium]MBT5659301.1 ACT domain-containing protein [Rhodospirillaceae bacterium]MBT5753227.1 ACT domain-containing protein [Rhodospirillaceae bacterium]